MSGPLDGKRVAFLVANSGVEQVELTTPWHAIEHRDRRVGQADRGDLSRTLDAFCAATITAFATV